MDSISFVFAALIYPKHMLKLYELHLGVSDVGKSTKYKELDSSALRKKIKRNWSTEGKKVIKIYHYMYRFSINKLHQLKKDKVLLHLFDFYYQKVGDLRIKQSKTMKKLPETYAEAALIITSEIRRQAAPAN